MRLFQTFSWIKPKYFDKSIKPDWKDERNGCVPDTNCTLFCDKEETYLWTEDGVYDIHTGKKVNINVNKEFHPIILKSDNKRVRTLEKDGRHSVSHPSFGMLRFDHVQGTSTLFGSPLAQNHFIELTIDGAIMEEDYQTDATHIRGEHRPKMEIRMSAEQVANAFFNTNRGDGVPCTITYTEMDGCIENPPYDDPLKKIDDKFYELTHQDAKPLSAYAAYLKREIKDKKTFSKGYVTGIIDHLESLARDTRSLSSYVSYYKEATENMRDTAMKEVVQRVDATINNAIKTMIGTQEGAQMFIEAIKQERETDKISSNE